MLSIETIPVETVPMFNTPWIAVLRLATYVVAFAVRLPITTLLLLSGTVMVVSIPHVSIVMEMSPVLTSEPAVFATTVLNALSKAALIVASPTREANDKLCTLVFQFSVTPVSNRRPLAEPMLDSPSQDDTSKYPFS
jgi:hypothetical protein